MNLSLSRSLALAGLAIALGACDALPPAGASAQPGLSLSPWGQAAGVEAEEVRFVPAELTAAADLRLAASERRGLLLLDGQGGELARLTGSFSGLDSRVLGEQLLVASLDSTAQQVALVLLDVQSRRWQRALKLPPRDFALSGLCLYRDEASNLHLFLLGEEGQGEQWL